METFSALLAICTGNSPVPGEFPSQRPVTRSFDVFFDLCLNKRPSKQTRGWWFETPSCPLWRHNNVSHFCGCVWGGWTIIFSQLRHTDPKKAGYLFLLLLCSLWWEQIIGYGMELVFVCLHITSHYCYYNTDCNCRLYNVKCYNLIEIHRNVKKWLSFYIHEKKWMA